MWLKTEVICWSCSFTFIEARFFSFASFVVSSRRVGWYTVAFPTFEETKTEKVFIRQGEILCKDGDVCDDNDNESVDSGYTKGDSDATDGSVAVTVDTTGSPAVSRSGTDAERSALDASKRREASNGTPPIDGFDASIFSPVQSPDNTYNEQNAVLDPAQVQNIVQESFGVDGQQVGELKDSSSRRLDKPPAQSSVSAADVSDAPIYALLQNVNPVPYGRRPIVEGVVLGGNSLLVEKVYLAEDSDSGTDYGCVIVSCNRQTCLDKFGLKLDKLQFYIGQGQLYDDYPSAATRSVETLNKYTFDNIKEGSTLGDKKAVVLYAPQCAALCLASKDRSNAVTLVHLTLRNEYCKSAITYPPAPTYLLTPEDSINSARQYVGYIAEINSSGYVVHLSGGIYGWLPAKSPRGPLFGTVVVRIDDAKIYERVGLRTYYNLVLIKDFRTDVEHVEPVLMNDGFSEAELKLMKSITEVECPLLAERLRPCVTKGITTASPSKNICNPEKSTPIHLDTPGIKAFTTHYRKDLRSQAIANLDSIDKTISVKLKSLFEDVFEEPGAELDPKVFVKYAIKSSSDTPVPHVRITKNKIKNQEGHSAYNKAYIGILALSDFELRLWTEPWLSLGHVTTGKEDAITEEKIDSSVVIQMKEEKTMVVFPASTVHTEVGPKDTDYLVMFITPYSLGCAPNEMNLDFRVCNSKVPLSDVCRIE